MFGAILFLLFLEQMLVWAKGLLFSLFFQLFILPLFFTFFKKITQNLSPKIPVSTLSFVDDSLFISQKKSFEKSNTNLFCSYSIISSLFKQFGLTIKYSKSEVFHFSRSTKNFDLFSLDLSLLGGPILQPKKNWRYLGFIQYKAFLSITHLLLF